MNRSIQPGIGDQPDAPISCCSATAIWLATQWCSTARLRNIALPTIAATFMPPRPSALGDQRLSAGHGPAATLAALGDRIGHARVYLPAPACSSRIVGMRWRGACQPDRCAMFQDRCSRHHEHECCACAGYLSSNILGQGMGYNALVLSIRYGPDDCVVDPEHRAWPWLFAVNVPVGIASFAVGSMPAEDRRARPPTDPSCRADECRGALGPSSTVATFARELNPPTAPPSCRRR